MRGLRGHLSFSNVIAVIALFVALGGSAWAVQVARKNSVTSTSIRDRTIRSVDIGRGQVRAANVQTSVFRDSTNGRTVRSFTPCTQNSTDFQDCLGAQVTLDRPGRIFATADGSGDSGAGSVPVGVNTCRLTVDGTAITSGFVVAADFSPGESFSFAGVSEPLAAGVHSVKLQCAGNGTLPGPRIFAPSLTTVTLGSG
jgi:hypothetical protein